MLTLNDSRWKQLHGGYRVPYDASVPLQRLERGEDVWAELWQNLQLQCLRQRPKNRLQQCYR